MWFICKVEKLLKIEKILVSSVGIPFIVHWSTQWIGTWRFSDLTGSLDEKFQWYQFGRYLLGKRLEIGIIKD